MRCPTPDLREMENRDWIEVPIPSLSSFTLASSFRDCSCPSVPAPPPRAAPHGRADRRARAPVDLPSERHPIYLTIETTV